MATPTGRIGGTIIVTIDGQRLAARGEFTCNEGEPKRETVIGQDGVHGYNENYQPAFVEGSITDRGDLDHKKLKNATNATISIVAPNGKTFTLPNAWFVGDGTFNLSTGELTGVRFEARKGEWS